MRWPWEWRKAPPLAAVPDDDDQAESQESTDALRRAKSALRKAETNGATMREVTGSIHRERQANHFSEALLRSMRRRET